MKPTKHEIVIPKPFLKISFECSTRAFYDVKADVFEIGEKIGIEVQDGHVDERCDYEGDLEEIIIYNGDRGKPLIEAVLSHYGVKQPDDVMDVHLSVY